MPNASIEVTPELVRTVDAMSWKGYLKLLGLFIIPLLFYHILFHRGRTNTEERFDALEVEVIGLKQAVQDLSPIRSVTPEKAAEDFRPVNPST